jgi:hypothetical protein
MNQIPADNLDLLDQIAVSVARQKRAQYLRSLDDLLNAFDTARDAASLDEIRAMFTAYEPLDMPPLSAEIEAMREER